MALQAFRRSPDCFPSFQLINLPLVDFAPLVSRVIDGVFQGPIRDAANAASTAALAQRVPCPGSVIPSFQLTPLAAYSSGFGSYYFFHD